MSRSTALLLALAMTAAMGSIGSPAEAAPRAATGERCTKVGTNGADRLVGTSRADVICGLGGNDVIVGGGGDDVVDAGRGDDRVRAGAGDDHVLGGSGRDVVVGDAGADQVDGGRDDDRVAGGSGADSLLGDRGDDRLDGGTGGDTLGGGQGRDQLLGRSGDDDLAGGPGVDQVDGGPGTNWCDQVSSDRHVACVIDRRAPEIHDIRPEATTVDVTTSEKQVTALVHATDDTGIRMVRGSARAGDGTATIRAWNDGLVRGDVRDGWWRVRYVVPRYLPAGDLVLGADAEDRLRRETQFEVPTGTVRVTNADPDREDPVLRSFAVDRTRVDVRTKSVEIWTRLRITDDRAGAFDPSVCLLRRTDDGYRSLHRDGCWSSNRISGTPRDGTYRVPYEVPRNAQSGTYVFRVCLTDRVRTSSSQCWISETETAYDRISDRDEPRPLIPGGGGQLSVVGLDHDPNPPVLVSVTATPSEVQASTGARLVRLDVAAQDPEGLAPNQVRARVSSDEHDLTLSDVFYPTLIDGTPEDGIWRFEVRVPGGTPAGRYRIDTWLADNNHERGWSPAEHTTPGDSWWAPYTPAQSATGGYLVVS